MPTRKSAVPAAAAAKKAAAKTAAKPATQSAKKPVAPPRRPTAADMKAVAQTLPYPARQADMTLQPQTDQIGRAHV